MPLDVDTVLNAPVRTRDISWTTRDVLLYHLSLGAGRDAARGSEPTYTYERGAKVLPTFALVAGKGPSVEGGDEPSLLSFPGVDIELRALLHAGQEVIVHRALPLAGRAAVSTSVVEVQDKGRSAVLVLQHDAVDPHGARLWTSRMQVWVRGEGGCGSGVRERAADATSWPVPTDGDPGGAPGETWASVDVATTADQALLYRLNGDMNPLHVDPDFAAAMGVPRPILHGLASYGVVAKALVDTVLDGDPQQLRGIGVRFSGTLEPGETLRIQWRRRAEQIDFVATCPERDEAPVLSHGWVLMGG